MLTAVSPVPVAMRSAKIAGDFRRWLRAHRGAVTVAGLLALAGPLTFFVGAISVMRMPSPANIAWVGLWWLLYGTSLWCLLLITGYACERLTPRLGPIQRGIVWLLAAGSAAAVANLLTAGRGTLLIEQGLVESVPTMFLNGFTVSLIMALLYFAHLRRSREYEQAAVRLAAAQTAQRDARRRIAQARLQEVQARIDPRLLFELLETMRRLYEADPARGERFVDELIVFLRAALPRLRTSSSSLARETELARAYVSLRALADPADPEMTIDVASDALHARFPPGVLLPLLKGGVGAGGCRLKASRTGDVCRLALTNVAAPSEESVAGVRSLLTEVYGSAGKLQIESATDAVNVIAEVPYELA